MVRTSLPLKGLFRICSIYPPLPWLKPPTLTKRHVYLQQRSTLPPARCLEMWVLLGPVENVDPPNVLAPFLCRPVERECGKFPLMPGIHMPGKRNKLQPPVGW